MPDLLSTVTPIPSVSHAKLRTPFGEGVTDPGTGTCPDGPDCHPQGTVSMEPKVLNHPRSWSQSLSLIQRLSLHPSPFSAFQLGPFGSGIRFQLQSSLGQIHSWKRNKHCICLGQEEGITWVFYRDRADRRTICPKGDLLEWLTQ